MQIGRTENANANNAKKKRKKMQIMQKRMQLTREKREKEGPRQKKRPFKMVQKNFTGALGAGYIVSFQGIKCKKISQKKARKCKKNATYKGKQPLQKKMRKKCKKKKCNHHTAKNANWPKMQKKCVCIFSPAPLLHSADRRQISPVERSQTPKTDRRSVDGRQNLTWLA